MRSLLASLTLLLVLPAAATALGPGDVDAGFGTDGAVFTRLGPLVEPGQSVAGARDVANAPGAGLVVVGSGPDADGDRALAVARYRSSGKPATAFGDQGVVVDQFGLGEAPSSAGSAVLAQPDGGAIVAGNATAPNGRTVFAVASYAGDGTREWLLRQPLDETVDAVALDLARDAAGRLLVSGRSGAEPFVARLDATGALDTSFTGTGYLVDPIDRQNDTSGCTLGDAPATAVLEVADGSVLVGGTLARTCEGGVSRPVAFLRRYDAAGARDTTFAPADLGLDRITALVPAPFSTGVVASGAVRKDGEAVPAIARIVGGVLDTDFPGPTGFGPLPGFGDQPGTASAVSAPTGGAGNLLVAVDVDDPARPDRVVRTDAGGQRDTGFVTTGLARAALHSPRAVAVQPDGRLVVAGDHPPASAREAQGFAVVRLFGGEAVSNVSLRSSAPVRKGALRLRLACSAGPGCAGVVRGRKVGTTHYAIAGGRRVKVDVPVLEKARRRAAFDVKVTNPPAAARSLTIVVNR